MLFGGIYIVKKFMAVLIVFCLAFMTACTTQTDNDKDNIKQSESQSQSQSAEPSSLQPQESFSEPAVTEEEPVKEKLPPPLPPSPQVSEKASLELPLEGATAYAAVGLSVYATHDIYDEVVLWLNAGQGFTITEDAGNWWKISSNGVSGWVLSANCMINLPDVIPSIIYDNTNTYSSLFRSSEKEIPNITGEVLYNGWGYNERLGKDEYIMPVLFGMAEKIYTAQQLALADQNTLIIYEAFRPSFAHQAVYDNFGVLIEEDEEVAQGVAENSYTANWFLAPAPYNHQRGTAIDVSLGEVISWEQKELGGHFYTNITEYYEYPMQTLMHELSAASAVFAYPVQSSSTTAWHNAQLSADATEGTILLQQYCAGGGLTPLASEWWHFNDLPTTQYALKIGVYGAYSLDKAYSALPPQVEIVEDETTTQKSEEQGENTATKEEINQLNTEKEPIEVEKNPTEGEEEMAEDRAEEPTVQTNS